MTSGGKLPEARLLLRIRYRGPWERLEGFFYGVRADNTLRFKISETPRGWRRAAAALGDYCDRRDSAWHDRHARGGTRPHRAWKRRGP
jgi:hypothetical protein